MARNRRKLRTPDEVEQDNRAVELRRRHLTFDQIAVELGLTGGRSAAYHAVKRGLADTVQESNDEVRQQETDRLDELARRVLKVIVTPHYKVSGKEVVIGPDRKPVIDSQPVLNGVNTLLKIMERRAELLGLNAPKQVEVLTIGMVDNEIARLTNELAAREGRRQGEEMKVLLPGEVVRDDG